jgi:hypothetical protein
MPFVLTPSQGDPLSTLLEEFYLRGFNALNDNGTGEQRAKRWINSAINELCEVARWPFLHATVTNAAPLALTDVRHVISVVDDTTGRELRGMNREDILTTVSTDLTTTGAPSVWYLEGTTLRVYPVSTDSLNVRYIAVPPDLVAAADVCVVPSRYTNLVVDLAVARGYRDKEAFEPERALRIAINEQLDTMLHTELLRGEDSFVLQTYGSEDG